MPRGRDPREPGVPCLAAVTFTSYATRDDAAMYRIDRTASTVRYEAVDPGTTAVTEFAASALNGDANGELRAMQFSYYDGDAFTGLALGQLGDHALPVRTEHLVITGDQLKKTTQPATDGATVGTLPPYLDPAGAAPADQDWPGYPEAFRQAVSGPGVPGPRGSQLGYTWHDAAPYAALLRTGQRLAYDVQSATPGPAPRGLVVVSRDAYGGDTTTEWDSLAYCLPGHRPGRADHQRRPRLPHLQTGADHRLEREHHQHRLHAARTARAHRPARQKRRHRGRHRQRAGPAVQL